MRRERRQEITWVMAALLAGAETAGAAASVAPDPVMEMAQTERAFAKRAGEIGWPAAFLEHFTPDAVSFTPEPGNAHERLRARDKTKPAGSLAWEPEISSLSSDGRLGMQLGPSVYTGPDGAPHHGYFFSVWKRPADGAFKVALDLGVETPAPAGAVAWRAIEPVSAGAAAGPVTDAEAALGRAVSSTGWTRGYATHLDPRAVLLRAGSAPLAAPAAIQKHLETLPPAGTITFEPDGSGAAESGDAAYTYGRCVTKKDGSPVVTGYYVHYWRRVNGAWKLLGDVFKLPAKKP